MSMSLPTPPRTTHKDKENQPLTPLTPSNSNSRNPRIVWSQENLHHAYTTQIRELPSSSRSQEPHKSILKKRSLPLAPLMPSEQSVREVTPEPADPLHHPLYLNSPVSTLVASLQSDMDARITLTDLTEAYSVLSARLKTKTHAMLEMCGPIPALEPLREHNSELVEAFHRDIRRAFIDPQSTPPPSRDPPCSTPSSVGSVKKRGFTEEEVKYARDLCNISHAAMRCFSNISVVPVLCSIFTDAQLGDILTDVLAIPLAASLPTPNARKTCQIAVWTLQVQRLPTAVLAPAVDRIAYALRRGIDGELGREGKKGAASDGLKAVATLASFQPAAFLPSFAEILPSVLASLTSQNLALRTQAAYAILSLSHALAHLPAPSTSVLAAFAKATTNYLAEQHKARRTPQDLSPLGRTFSVCLNTESPTHSSQSPMWALSVITAIIVLSGGDALTHSRTIKFVLGHLQTAMAVKRTTVRATAGLVWRALVWACVQLDKGNETEDKRDGGWRVVRQIVDGAIGISLVAALLGQKDTKGKRVLQALEVVSAMIKKGGKTCEEAVDIMERLLCGVGSNVQDQTTEKWADEMLLAEPLFDGTLLQVEWKALAFHVKDGLNKSVAVRDVRRLQENEVTKHWSVLFVIWKEAVERAPLGEDGEVPPPLLSAWQALLLAQAQLTQGCEHLTSEPTFISELTLLLKSFLTDQSLEWSLDAGAPSWSSQPLKLGFVRNLWTVARNVFAMPALAGAAETLLCEVLKHEYHLEQSEVRVAWATLCAELVLAGAPRLVRELWEDNQRGRDLETKLKRGLWRTVSQQWVDQAGSWSGAIELLRAPFTLPYEWEFDEDDCKLWVRLVECSLVAASARKVPSNTVLDAIASEIGMDHGHPFLYHALPFLLLHIDGHTQEYHTKKSRLPLVLLKLAGDMLAAHYPTMNERTKPMLLAVVSALADVVKTAPKEALVEILVLIQNGVKLWIEDEKIVFTDQAYNHQIIPFYVASLEALGTIAHSSQTIHILTPLLVSAFNHIPEPALGPSAFKDFWLGIHLSLEQSGIEYPEDLKPILRNVQEAMCISGEVFAPGLSQETQTQTLDTVDLVLSIIPDSLEGEDQQCISSIEPHLQPSRALDVLLDREMEVELGYQLPFSEPHCPHVSPVREPDSLAPPSSPMSPSSLPSGLPKEATLETSPLDLTKCSIIQIEQRALSEGVAETQSGGLPKQSSVLPPIKKESPDPHANTGMAASQTTNPSQSLRSSGSFLGKRRRTRLASHPSKKRKSDPPVGVDIIEVSDDEDSEQIALDLSITVNRAKRKKSKTDLVSVYKREGEASTLNGPTPKYPRRGDKKRSFFDAVEIPRLSGLRTPRRAARGRSPDVSPRKSKEISRTRSDPNWHEQRDEEHGNAENIASPPKRRRISESLSDGGISNEWNDLSPHQKKAGSGIDDTDILETPLRPSDTSIPSSQTGQISAGYIISPSPRRSRSEVYDPPSDDTTTPSSPLKHVAARRRLHRARTVPVLPTSIHREESHMPGQLAPTRSPSEEFLALEHAHVVVTSGASRMELQELLVASRMANGISVALSDQMTKKMTSSRTGLS